MAKCSFCGESIEKGTGKMFIYISGKIDYFCSRACEQNLTVLKRKPLQTPWTKKYRDEHAAGKGAKGDTKQ